jgi:N-formylglutamate amidohydrolase
MTDAWTDDMVAGLGLPATRIMFPVSRLVVDVERFQDDADEPMASKGMGALYTRLSTGEPLRHLDPAQRRRLMASWYQPHHQRLTQAVDDALAEHGHCLIIDVHSFSSTPLPHEPDQDPQRPEICLGTDAFHSPFRDDQEALDVVRAHGFTVALNRPFAGSLVPSKHWSTDARVRSVMIEVRRDLYMDEATGAKLPGFGDMAARVCRVVEGLAGYVDNPDREWL